MTANVIQTRLVRYQCLFKMTHSIRTVSVSHPCGRTTDTVPEQTMQRLQLSKLTMISGKAQTTRFLSHIYFLDVKNRLEHLRARRHWCILYNTWHVSVYTGACVLCCGTRRGTAPRFLRSQFQAEMESFTDLIYIFSPL